MVGDTRGVYYRRPFYANSVFDEPFFSQAACLEETPEGILERVRRLGVTHLVVNLQEGMRVSADYHQYYLKTEQWKNLTRFAKWGLTPLYFKDLLAVFEVNPQIHVNRSAKPYVLNLFSFFYPPAYDLLRDFQNKDYAKAEKEAGMILALFPNEGFWLEKRALIYQAEGNRKKAMRDFQQADKYGGLSLEGYQSWAQLARDARNEKASKLILQRAWSIYLRDSGK